MSSSGSNVTTTSANGESGKEKKRERLTSSKTVPTTHFGGVNTPNNPYWSSNEGKRIFQHIRSMIEHAKSLEHLLTGVASTNMNSGNIFAQYPFYGLPPFGPIPFGDPMNYNNNMANGGVSNNITTNEVPDAESVGNVKKKSDVKRKRAERKPKDPDAPKQPLSSYMLFSQANMDRLKGTSHGQRIGIHIGEEWRKLSPDERKPYEDRASRLRLQYNKAMEAYKAKKAAEQHVEATASHDDDDEEVEEEESLNSHEQVNEEDDDEIEEEEKEMEPMRPPTVKKSLAHDTISDNARKKKAAPAKVSVDEDNDTNDEEEVVPPAKKVKSISAPAPTVKSSPVGPPNVRTTAGATPDGASNPVRKIQVSASIGSPPSVGHAKKGESEDVQKKKKRKSLNHNIK